MRYLIPLVLSGLILTFGCLGSAQLAAPAQDPPPAPLVFNLELEKLIKGNIVRLQGRDKAYGSFRFRGTGFIIKADSVGAWVITNQHIHATFMELDVEPYVDRIEAKVAIARYKAEWVHVAPKRDIAILFVPGMRATPLPLAPDYFAPGKDTVVLICGFPSECKTPVLSLGNYLGLDDGDYELSANGWYGNSGSMIVDLRNRQIIGVLWGFAHKIRFPNGLWGWGIGSVTETHQDIRAEFEKVK